MSEWKKCMKTRIVEVRDVRPDEDGIETLEGFKPCHPDAHFIMRGTSGEEYPIEQDIFNDTYMYVDSPLFDDELCHCGHSKGYHGAHDLDDHGGKCEKCDCTLYTWRKFVRYVEMT